MNGIECAPGAAIHDLQFASGDGTYADTRSYTFVCTGFPLVHHNTATVEWASFDGAQVAMHQPTMVVRYG